MNTTNSNPVENHPSHKKLYFIIFAALTILTLIELWIPSLKDISSMTKGISLTLLALGKAALVAYIYMHLNQETRWLKFIALIPISAALFALVLCLETVYR